MMTKCEKCDTWMTSERPLCSACTDTLGQIRAKVAEHKGSRDDYMLVRAAFVVLRELLPKYPDPAWIRATSYLLKADRDLYHWANANTYSLTPRRRWQDKENA